MKFKPGCSGDRSPAQSSPVGTGQNLIRDTKRKREGLGPDLTLHGKNLIPSHSL